MSTNPLFVIPNGISEVTKTFATIKNSSSPQDLKQDLEQLQLLATRVNALVNILEQGVIYHESSLSEKRHTLSKSAKSLLTQTQAELQKIDQEGPETGEITEFAHKAGTFNQTRAELKSTDQRIKRKIDKLKNDRAALISIQMELGEMIQEHPDYKLGNLPNKLDNMIQTQHSLTRRVARAIRNHFMYSASAALFVTGVALKYYA